MFASPWVANPRKGRLRSSFPIPQKLGTDPTIGRKIKGLRGFGGRAQGGEGAGVGGGEGVALGVVWGRGVEGGGEKKFKFPLDTPLRG